MFLADKQFIFTWWCRDLGFFDLITSSLQYFYFLLHFLFYLIYLSCIFILNGLFKKDRACFPYRSLSLEMMLTASAHSLLVNTTQCAHSWVGDKNYSIGRKDKYWWTCDLSATWVRHCFNNVISNCQLDVKLLFLIGRMMKVRFTGCS